MPIAVSLFVTLFAILPILIRMRAVPSRFRLLLLGLVAMGVIGWLSARSTWLEAGMRTDNLAAAWPAYAAATLALSGGLFAASRIFKTSPVRDWKRDPHFLFLFVPISIVQQIIYQSFLLQQLRSFLPGYAAIVACALLFGLLHIIYPRPLRSFLMSAGAGAAFASLFYFYPNLMLASLMHSALNFLAVRLSFFTLHSPERD